MTTGTLPLNSWPSPARAWRRARRQLLFGVTCTGAVLPLALLLAPGPLMLVGVAYALVWSLAFIPTTTALGFLIVDATRMLRRTGPYLLTTVLSVEVLARGELAAVRRSRPGLFATVAIYMNPLSMPTAAFLELAIKARPDVMRQIAADVTETVNVVRHAANRQRVDPTIEFSRPVVERAMKGLPQLSAADPRQVCLA